MLVDAGRAKARQPSSDSTPPAPYWVVVNGETGNYDGGVTGSKLEVVYVP